MSAIRQILSLLGSAAKTLWRVEEFHHHRGQIISLWAAIEHSIDMANATAWEYSDRTISKVVPINLRWKLELFERIHRDLIPFQDMRSQAEVLIAAIKARQEDRHWLAHGMVDVIATKAGSWTLKKGVFQADGSLGFETRQFTANEVSEIRSDLHKLSAKVARYSYTLGKKVREGGMNN